MSPQLHWTGSIAKAWEYIVHSIAQGYGPTASYQEYTAGGGEIRTSYWFDAWHEAQNIKPNADFVLRMPEEWTLPQSRFTDVAWDTRQDYIVQAKISYFDKEKKEWVADWRSVEFAQPPTRAELEAVIRDKLIVDYTERRATDWALLDVNLYHSTGPVFE